MWWYDGAPMVVRTQITLDADAHRRAKRRAADLGISFAEYVRRTLDQDLGDEPKGDISEIFGLFDSGDPMSRSTRSNISTKRPGASICARRVSQIVERVRRHLGVLRGN